VQVPATGCDTLWVKNNILAGAKTGGLILGTPIILDSSHNYITNFLTDVRFENVAGFDYHLTAVSPVLNKGVVLQKKVKGRSLQPAKEYKDDCNFVSRLQQGAPDIGALEYSSINSAKPRQQSEAMIRYFFRDKMLILSCNGCMGFNRVSIYSQDGKRAHDVFVPFERKDASVIINTQNFPSGIYTLVLEHRDGQQILRVMID
jgi:hypothetical protein